MTTHKLKIWPMWFEAVAEGRKRAEYMANDRGYEVGDKLLLQEYIPPQHVLSRGQAEGRYTGRELLVHVTHVAVLGAHAMLSIEMTEGGGSVDVLARAAVYLSPKQVRDLIARLAEIATRRAGR